MSGDRYSIRRTSRGFGVWDTAIQVWQTIQPTREAAEQWIDAKLIEDAKPQSWRGYRGPLPD